jgi:cytochrome c553
MFKPTRIMFLSAAAAGILAAASGQAAETPAPSAANMAVNCFSCHGPEGRSPGAIPSLHHLTAANIAALMKQFRSGERPSTVMGRHAKGYTDAEVDALASYIAGLKK